MPRRHSVCLSDIPSFEQFHPQVSRYEDPDKDTTIWAFRSRPSTPTMTVTTESASATPAKPTTNTTTAEDNKHEQQPQDSPQTMPAKKKKKNKKKKPKSRAKGKDKLDQDQDQTEGSTVETEIESLPQLIQPMPLGTPAPFIVNSASWHKVDESNEDGLQRFLSSQRLYAGDSDSPSVTELTPSTTTDTTVRATSNHGDKPAQQEQPQQQPSNVPEQPPLPNVCPEHTRMLCQFVPGCCVHKPRHCQYCPFPMSCCCAHHSGDCCYCAFSPGQAYEGDGEHKKNGGNVNPETSAPADPKPETVSKPVIVIESNLPDTSASDASLRTHTLTLLEDESFTDSRINLHSPRNSFYLTFHTHKALLARSPRLAAILTFLAHSPSNDSKNTSEVEIEVLVGETFYMLKAFETALQNLYGLPLLNRQNLPRFTMMAMGYTGEDVHRTVKFGMSAATADFAICYAVSGAFLGVSEIMETGMNLAMESVDWENIEMVLYFALSVSKFLITCPGDPLSLQFLAEQELVNTWIPRLRTYVLIFIATYLQHLQQQKESFDLYVSAQPKGMPDRIPEHLRKVPGSILSNPKLAEVKFGSFGSVEEQQKINPNVVLISAILIGLPYKLLQEAFDIMVERKVLNENQASTIVIEREARRLYALRVWGAQRMDHGGGGVGDDEEVKELGYREIVTRKNGKVLLERVWVGLK